MSLQSQQPPEGRPSRPRVIKRYANRKLYDTRDSRYVTLQQIAEYVRGGEEVSIIDNTTKEDLTNVTLAQIVYEEERKNGHGDEGRRGSPSVGALRTLIQQSGERLMSTLRDMPVGKLIARRDADGATEAPVEEPAKQPAAAPEKADEAAKRSLILNPKDAWDELQRLADDRMKAVLGTAIGHVHQLQGEVKRLQGRIEELEQKLVSMQQGPTARGEGARGEGGRGEGGGEDGSSPS